MTLHSLRWDKGFRLRRCHDNPIGWTVLDATGRRVGAILDLLADDRTRQVVYAITEVEGVPPVLVDLDRLTLDPGTRQASVTLTLHSLQRLSPATWWRRPPARQPEALPAAVTATAEQIVVPVYGEQLVIEKHPVILEEIIVTKRPGVRQETVRETLRREQAEVIEIPRAGVPSAQGKRAA